MPEELTFRFIDEGRKQAGRAGGGSPTAEQFATPQDRPSEPLATPSERVETKQDRTEPERQKPAEAPKSTTEPAKPTEQPKPPGPTVPQQVVPEAPPQPPVVPPQAPSLPQEQLASLAAVRGGSIPTALAAAGSSAALPLAVGAIAVKRAVDQTVGIVRAVDTVVEELTGDVARFSPDIQVARARARAAGISQQIDIAERLGPDLAVIESIKAKSGRVVTGLKAGAVGVFGEVGNTALQAIVNASELLLGQGEETTRILEKMDKRFMDWLDGGGRNALAFDKPHLDPPDFDGAVITSGRDQNTAPTGLTLQ